jgi:Ca-activated chloride channel family protein
LNFDSPRILGFLLLFFAFIPVIFVRRRKSRERAALFAAASPSGEREFFLRELRSRMFISDILFMLFVGLLIVALAGPRWGMRIVADYRRGVDVVLAFDLSRSMNVRDGGRSSDGGENSRLERGLEIARRMASTLGDMRLGAAVGKGRGILAVPLTYDSEAILTFLSGLDSQAITGRGTDLESLLDASSGAFQYSIPSRRVIILFSDGEALSGSFAAGVEKVRKTGIILNTVGLGSDQGGSVPVEKGPDAPDGFLLGGDGKAVISRTQTDTLRNGAEKSGGIYVDGSRNDADRILEQYVSSLSAESRLSGYRREVNPRWRIFILAAMACLGGSRAMGFSHRRGGRAKNAKALSLLLCLMLFSSCARTRGMLYVMEGNFFNTRGFYTEAISSYLKALAYEEIAPYAEYGLGAVYFSMEEGEAALERYRAAEQVLMEMNRQDHGELRYRILYNTGIIHFEKGEYDEAVQAFREALKIDGGKIEAKRNLELSLLTINRTNSLQAASAESRTEEGSEISGRGGSQVLFEYLKQKEQNQWKSREWSGEGESAEPDY